MIHDKQLISILFLTADPKDATRLRLGQELRDIRETLKSSKCREKFVLSSRESVRPGDISQAILDLNPDIVHFSGHGLDTGELCCEDSQGNIKPVSPDALSSLFELVQEQVQCVFLNACYSKSQAQSISNHINFIIGISSTITDSAAIAFATGFYKALGAQHSIEKSYKFGCAEIQLQGITDTQLPVLHRKSCNDGKQAIARYELTLNAILDDIDGATLKAIVSRLRSLAGDDSLTLHEYRVGSIILELEGSADGFEIIEHLIASGRLREIEQIPIHTIQLQPNKTQASAPSIVLAELTQPIHTDLLRLLREGEFCISDLCERLNIAQSKLSFQLKTLKKEGLVTARQKGRWIYYSLTPQQHDAIGDYIESIEKDNIFIIPAESSKH